MENRYDKYKDSGIAWIGEIPEHWEVKRLKNVCSTNNASLSDKTSKEFEFDYVDIGSVSFELGIHKTEKYTFQNAPSRARKIARLGDIIVSTVRTYLRAIDIINSGEKEKYIYSTGFAILSPLKNILSEFMIYICRSEYFTNQVSIYSTGINYPSINDTALKMINIVMPTLSEQQTIAAYLDQKCGEIDELITLQEEMITKLQSYKQSVITEAVTKGLDKNVPLKDSGIEWIGEIPEHWEVRRMKSIYNFGKGLSITKADLVDKGIPVISYGQIHSKLNIGTCIKDSLIRYVPKVFLENNNTSLVKKGDVIFADTSEDLEGCGNCIYIDMDMLLYAGYHTIIAKNISTSYNRYFSYLFQTDCWRFQIRRMVNGVKLFSIPQKLLASADLIVPSTQEQQSIADYLDQRCSEIDELISIKQQKIEKLKEYKKSLIFECVTGKRKVS